MTPADNIQRFLIHCLRIDRNPLNTMGKNHIQLFFVETVRPSGFNSKLPHMG